MAYGNYLASLEWIEVENLRRGLKPTVTPHNIAVASHILPGAVKKLTTSGTKSVATCLTDIFDKGEVLSQSFWHPLRAPLVHSPQAVRVLSVTLQTALENVDIDPSIRSFFDLDITPILNVIADAVNNGLGLISVLEPPADDERAQRVACPFGDPDKLPIPWGHLKTTLNPHRR